jgi:hypothetical protein
MTSIGDLSDSMSLGQTLSTSLLSNLPEHEGDECDADSNDEEEGCMPCFLKIAVDNEELDEVSDDDSSPPSWWNANCRNWIVLHALFFSQLCLGLHMSGTEGTVTMSLCWSVKSYVVVLFVAIATLYRQTIKCCKPTCTVVILAPEILIVIILGLVILGHLDAAFLFMLGSTMCLAILVAAMSIQGLIATSSSAEEDGCKQLQGKLDVSLC